MMKESQSVKKNLGRQISHDGHQSARNRGCSTEGFSKMDQEVQKYSKYQRKENPKFKNNDNITKLDQCPCQDLI